MRQPMVIARIVVGIVGAGILLAVTVVAGVLQAIEYFIAGSQYPGIAGYAAAKQYEREAEESRRERERRLK